MEGEGVADDAERGGEGAGAMLRGFLGIITGLP